MDLVDHFALAASNASYDALSPAAAEAAKKSVLDVLGVILAASGMEPEVTGLIDLVRETGGQEEATIVSCSGRYPAAASAFANGAMAHCLDFDDLTPWGHHCSSSIVPAVLAVAERAGNVHGRDVITAVAVGQDLFTRLRRNIDWRREWNLSTVFGVYAATAAAGRVLGLPSEQVAHALGIASMHSAGMTEMIAGTSSDLHGMYAGFSARGAVEAVLLAQRGVTGIPQLFEGDYGVFASYFQGQFDRAAMLEGLGEDFRGADTEYKAWPCVGTSHSHIKATIDLVANHGLTGAQIKEIRLYVGDYHELTCRPLEARRAPKSRADAQYSLPYLVAVAAVRGGIDVSDFTEDALRNEDVLRTAAKVVPIPDPALNWHTELPLGRVRILTEDGRSVEAVGDRVPGSASAPLTWDALEAKFANCAAVAAAPPSSRDLRQLKSGIRELEGCADVGQLIRLVAAPAPVVGASTGVM
ncbi:MmgE/PrpD family protein [Nocardioides pocheonensis]|uniref:MmgE/PrpD family protein n=1 Tax=Nocardioides pocheonensis TaxID=661485 RepID=A0A3N0GJ85_9ACTN|nr:MmgE/PrpD family protein [Nocardioides pocheonensis]RNM12178.1 MmgE/PrpD family protein [Nocardioides pocheonensis]